MLAHGGRSVHAKRILRGYYDAAGRPDLTSASLPKSVLAWLATMPMLASEVIRSARSEDGTEKILVGYADGARVESVLMPDYRPDRAAGCLSTQVGCAMNCGFCATGVQGFSRNLSAGEIVEQYLHLKRASIAIGRRLSTVVLMGMGEPLLNLANVARAVDLLAGETTGHLGHRQITVSTVGPLSQLRDFVDMRLNVQLAISLHAPDEMLRGKLIPIAQKNPIAEILDLAQAHQANTGRVAIVQYCLLEGVNDSDEHAHALARLMNGRQMHVNLLTYNDTGQGYAPATPERVDRFLIILRDHRLVAHTRRSRGSDIAAACGQLRADARP